MSTVTMLQIGADTVEALMAGVRMLLADQAYTAKVLRAERTRALEYELVAGFTPERGTTLLAKGEVSSIWVVPKGGMMNWAILYCPGFDGTGPPVWNAVIEYCSSVQDVWVTKLMDLPGIRYVVLAKEESIELNLVPDVSTFPWNDPTLIAGAIRTDGGVVLRRGPAAGP